MTGGGASGGGRLVSLSVASLVAYRGLIAILVTVWFAAQTLLMRSRIGS
jgi:hypothetical protein